MQQSIDRLPDGGGGGGESAADDDRVINNTVSSTASMNPPSVSMETDHWPSLPPIRTSSSNSSKVSCETLNIVDGIRKDAAVDGLPESSAAQATSDDPSDFAAGAAAAGIIPSKKHVKPAAEPDNDAVHGGGVNSILWLLCFPMEKHRRRQPPDPAEIVENQRGSPAAAIPQPQGSGGCSQQRSPPSSAKSAAAARRFRSLIGLPGSSIPQYSSAMSHFSGPLNQAATAGYGGGISPGAAAAISPKGRAAAAIVSSISPTRRSNSKAAGSGRRGQGSMFFTLPPPAADWSGGQSKKVAVQRYETEEPTSPRVSCMGRVVRRQKKCEVRRRKKMVGRTVASPPPKTAEMDYDSRGNGGGGRRDRRTSSSGAANNIGKGSWTPVDVDGRRTDPRRMASVDSVAADGSRGAGSPRDNEDFDYMDDSGAADIPHQSSSSINSSSLEPPNPNPNPNLLLLTRNSRSRR